MEKITLLINWLSIKKQIPLEFLQAGNCFNKLIILALNANCNLQNF